MGEICNMHEIGTKFWLKNLNENVHSKDLGVAADGTNF